jgi:hypothetical protein
MILLLIAGAWIAVLSLVTGACMAARAGDLQQVGCASAQNGWGRTDAHAWRTESHSWQSA